MEVGSEGIMDELEFVQIFEMHRKVLYFVGNTFLYVPTDYKLTTFYSSFVLILSLAISTFVSLFRFPFVQVREREELSLSLTERLVRTLVHS